MATTESIDLNLVAGELNLPLPGIQRTVELFEDGNTVAFIARFRKDQTGGFNEEQIRQIGDVVRRQRASLDRKQTILKSIESQGKLTPHLAAEIQAANSPKILEDLYLPFRPKKQTLATLARKRGLEPFAREILSAAAPAPDLEQRATDFAQQLPEPIAAAEVLAGVGHLLAETFSENTELHNQLRKVMQRTGRLVSSRVDWMEKTEAQLSAVSVSSVDSPLSTSEVHSPDEPSASGAARSDDPAPTTDGDALESAQTDDETSQADDETSHVDHEAGQAEDEAGQAEDEAGQAEDETAEIDHDFAQADSPTDHGVSDSTVRTDPSSLDPSHQTPSDPSGPTNPTDPSDPAPSDSSLVPLPSRSIAAEVRPNGAMQVQRSRTADRKSKQREKKRRMMEAAFKDYFQFSETLVRIPPHRVLALNRGERAKILRIKIDSDVAAIETVADELLIPPQHPYAEFLRACLRDALTRLIVPSLEREARRDLTDMAESRALDVFVRNLRHLLLQPPVEGRRILAIDPGFRSGCKMVALDEFGNVLSHGVLHIVGKDEWRAQGRAQLVNLVQQYKLSVIAIGNGAGCRGTEQVVSEIIANELQGQDVAYVIVNEAGTNEYSTSPIGREELTDYDPTLRSAISIGRRLLDPLSELVKINPANIGVGLYQHDMKAKHLRDSLDAVVESCVNYVGVDVNTASPALLRYVSGLNQLTARRVYDYRREHGSFRNREQLRQVPGVGEATYIQSAGFLRIIDGDNPLDATWIHPESYENAKRVLERLNFSVEDLRVNSPKPPTVPVAVVPVAVVQPVTVSSDAPLDPPNQAPADQAPADQPPADQGPPEQALSEQSRSDPFQSRVPSESAPSEPAPSEPAPSEPAPSDSARAPVQIISVAPESRPLAQSIAKVDISALAQELDIGSLSLSDMLAALSRPGRDPREDLSPPVFRRGIIKLEDLQPGMELSGTVLNVVDFGAFVDIGISDSGLVHISRLADRFVRDPHEVVSVGDVLKVWVIEVDKARRRVSLTAIRPGSERPIPKKPSRGPERAPRQAEDGTRSVSDGQPSGSPPPPHSAARHQRSAAGGGGGGGRGARPPKFETRRPMPQKKPKPVVPITKAMEDGKEPLRSFSDLLQFYELKKKPDEPD